MQTIYLYKGLPGSGKTTKAKEVVAASEGKIKRINKDDLRAMLDGGKFSKEREKFILQFRDDLISSSLLSGFNVIIDDTNLHGKHEKKISELVSSLRDGDGIPVEIIIDDSFCKVPIAECIRRDALRPNPVGKQVIRRMAREFGIGQVEPYYIPGLPSCVICDLDGTLAHMGKRNPFDASTCGEDKVDKVVAELLIYYRQCGIDIIYFSGRSNKHRFETEQWLADNNLAFHSVLAMRPDSSMAKDVIIKKAMFEEHIRGKYNVHVVFDDRQQCVELWRDLGLKCFQVAEGDF